MTSNLIEHYKALSTMTIKVWINFLLLNNSTIKACFIFSVLILYAFLKSAAITVGIFYIIFISTKFPIVPLILITSISTVCLITILIYKRKK